MAKKLKVENGKVECLYKTFDGSYVRAEMPEALINEDDLIDSSDIKGYELTDGKYLFATTEAKSKRSSLDDKLGD